MLPSNEALCTKCHATSAVFRVPLYVPARETRSNQAFHQLTAVASFAMQNQKEHTSYKLPRQRRTISRRKQVWPTIPVSVHEP